MKVCVARAETQIGAAMGRYSRPQASFLFPSWHVVPCWEVTPITRAQPPSIPPSHLNHRGGKPPLLFLVCPSLVPAPRSML